MIKWASLLFLPLVVAAQTPEIVRPPGTPSSVYSPKAEEFFGPYATGTFARGRHEIRVDFFFRTLSQNVEDAAQRILQFKRANPRVTAYFHWNPTNSQSTWMDYSFKESPNLERFGVKRDVRDKKADEAGVRTFPAVQIAHQQYVWLVDWDEWESGVMRLSKALGPVDRQTLLRGTP